MFLYDPPLLRLRLLLSTDNVRFTKKPGGVCLLIRSGKCESVSAASGLLDFETPVRPVRPVRPVPPIGPGVWPASGNRPLASHPCLGPMQFVFA